MDTYCFFAKNVTALTEKLQSEIKPLRLALKRISKSTNKDTLKKILRFLFPRELIAVILNKKLCESHLVRIATIIEDASLTMCVVSLQWVIGSYAYEIVGTGDNRMLIYNVLHTYKHRNIIQYANKNQSVIDVSNFYVFQNEVVALLSQHLLEILLKDLCFLFCCCNEKTILNRFELAQ